MQEHPPRCKAYLETIVRIDPHIFTPCQTRRATIRFRFIIFQSEERTNISSLGVNPPLYEHSP